MNDEGRPSAITSRTLFAAERLRVRRIPLALLGMVAIGAAGSAMVAMHRIASASASASHPPTACYSHPSSRNCDNTDPVASGCAADGMLVQGMSSRDVRNIAGVSLGRLDLMWSPHCGTNWARVNVGVSLGRANILIYAFKCGSQPKVAEILNTTGAWSDMVYAPNAVNGRPAVPAGVGTTFNNGSTTMVRGAVSTNYIRGVSGAAVVAQPGSIFLPDGKCH